jgi:hypothetical protein
MPEFEVLSVLRRLHAGDLKNDSGCPLSHLEDDQVPDRQEHQCRRAPLIEKFEHGGEPDNKSAPWS